MRRTIRFYLLAAVVIIVAAAIIIALASRLWRTSTIAIDSNSSDQASLTQVIAITQLAQWECLTIEDEELIDTVRHSLFGSDHLARIYYGTLRIGFTLDDTTDDWLTTDNGTVVVTLPPLRLLDDDFIDEARTKPFYETGHWSDKARKEMYGYARDKMLARCLTADNLRRATANAEQQMRSILTTLGYTDITIHTTP